MEASLSTLAHLFEGISTTTPQPIDRTVLPLTMDPHVHCRLPKRKGDGRSEMVINNCAIEHGIIIDIANTTGGPDGEGDSGPKVLKRQRMLQALVPEGSPLRIHCQPLVGSGTDRSMIRDVRLQPTGQEAFTSVKVFFRGVSNAETAIDDVADIRQLIEDSTLGPKPPTVFTWHAECLRDSNGEMIPIRDREWYCVKNQISRALCFNPNARHVLRHVSDWRTIELAKMMRAQGFDIHLELSPQYFIHTADSIFMADDASHAVLQCHCVYWPRPKDEQSRRAIVALALEGHDWVHIGTDFAMHLDNPMHDKGVKINRRGMAVGGLNLLPSVAKAVIIEVAVQAGKPEILPGLLARNAARAYNVELPPGEVTYIRKPWVVPEFTEGKGPKGKKIRAVNFLRGHTMQWQQAA